ncbi:MAG: hypothetical protein B7Z15_15090 [Rhizobiales bacterium 32-66-8]|nr:MAG: hypothetical protein B7Z15_15090 [Rhizobiales bacterium 32-66-8]
MHDTITCPASCFTSQRWLKPWFARASTVRLVTSPIVACEYLVSPNATSLRLKISGGFFLNSAMSATYALRASFALVSDTPFQFERQETRMDFAVIGRRNNLAITAKFLLQALNRGGEMFVIIPQSALTPLRQALSRTTPQESTGRDPKWAQQIRGEVNRTNVKVRAILEERPFPLGDIANFKVGQVIKLQATPRSRIKLESNDQPLFWCHLGQSEGSYVLRVDDQINQNQEFLDDILPR